MDSRILWLLLITVPIIATVIFLVRHIMKNYVFNKEDEEIKENDNNDKDPEDAGSNLIKSVDKDKLN